MMNLEIPGSGTLHIENLLLDYNGTLALDGSLLPGVEDLLNELSANFRIHIITADTFGNAASELKNVNCTFIKLGTSGQTEAKLKYLTDCGRDVTACIGNGKNDRLMLKESVLGIALIQGEGACTGTLLDSDIVCTDIFSALEFFRKPARLVATLRE